MAHTSSVQRDNQPAAPLIPHLSDVLLRIGAAAVAGFVLLLLAFQIPVVHHVDLGGYDAAYTQGFSEPEPVDSPFLIGSDGSARWSRDVSYLLFPQAGLGADITLHVRGRPGEPGTLTVLLNDQLELGRIVLNDTWQAHTFTIDAGLLKPSDVVIALRGEARQIALNRPLPVTALIDRATYRVGPPPIIPYPWPLAYAAAAAAMLQALLLGMSLTPRRRLMLAAGGIAALTLALLLFYRMQPPFYPLVVRGLPLAICSTLAGLLALRYGRQITAAWPWLLDAAAPAALAAWVLFLLPHMYEHRILAVPGVENDFRVFAGRSTRLFGSFSADGFYSAATDGVLRADGFYNIGYPLLLWLVRPLVADNPFLAARLIAVCSGVLLVAAGWWLARRLLGRAAALIVLATLATSSFVVGYALSLGTDMPFAALCALTLALVLAPPGRQHGWIAAAGLLAGAAFVVRHPGLLLLPIGWLALWQIRSASTAHASALRPAIFTLAFLLAITPQIAVNLRDTGQPLFSQQAKNIWLAVYADGDWRRWEAVPNSIGFGELLARDPGRLLNSWWFNLRSFVGTGSEDTSEFGRAWQLRLLGFPANWLAIGGLLGWLGQSLRPTAGRRPWPLIILLGWLLLYVVAVSIGISLPRFFLPLTVVYALAAGWAAMQLADRIRWRGDRLLLIGLLLMLLLADGFRIGAAEVLSRQQPDAQAMVRLVELTLLPDEQLAVGVSPRDTIGKYSAIAHRVVEGPIPPRAVRGPAGVTSLLWRRGAGAPPQQYPIVGAAGGYTLYRVE